MGLCINYRAKFTPGWPTANTGLLYKLLRTKLDFYNESNTRREASLPHSFNRENRENITFKLIMTSDAVVFFTRLGLVSLCRHKN